MSTKKKQGTNFARNSSITTAANTSTSFSNRSGTKTEKSVLKIQKVPAILPKLLPYTPPDVLMFDLFSALQRKAWTGARRLCYELILCDPGRQTYRNLYERINQIVKVIDRRRHPRQIPISRTITASSTNSNQRTTNRK